MANPVPAGTGLLSGIIWCRIQAQSLVVIHFLKNGGDWMIVTNMDDLSLIKQKINVVDLIQEYLPLKKTGINFKALCPFHSEKTPSFVVSPERQIWHCFGCGAGGDIFKFLMEKEGLEFKDALELLAKKAGIVLKRTPQKKDYKHKLFEINSKASQFFTYMLTEHPLGKSALDYLKKRGITIDSIKEFNLGYAPLNWETLVRFLEKRGFSKKEIIDSGLAVASQRGGYDRFRGRIMFPLLDVSGRVLGFAGRILEGGRGFALAQDGPKYINSPQTPIFDKSKFLFGINLSKAEIKQKNESIIVEGELDMIASYQAGIKNIVASKGTALTENQLELIKRYSETIILCFDSDLAGDTASRRGIEIADRLGLNIKVIEVEGEKDPADLCLKNPKDWEKLVDSSISIYDYYLKSSAKRYSLKSASGKKAISQELVPIWQTITDPLVKEHYIQKLAATLAVKEDIIRAEVRKKPKVSFEKPIRETQIPENEEIVSDRRFLLEEYLIALLLHLPSNITYVPTFPETIFTKENFKQIYVMLVLFLDAISFAGRSFNINDFIKTLPPDMVEEVDRIYLMQIDERLTSGDYWQKELGLVVSELKKMLIKASLEKLSLKIKQAQTFEKVESLEVLNKRFRDLSVKLKSI